MIQAPLTAAALLPNRPAGLAETVRLVDKWAPISASVLIQGETGVGKEMVARALHLLSPRAGQPFYAVNCGAIPPELIGSELFGHVKGGFTGAVDDRPGAFQAANGGTLFLDEIGDLPLALQAHLLRVVQERTYRPIGSDREESVNVRIISATHRRLRHEVAAGRFREDLLFRLGVLIIEVPALREHPEDLDGLTDALLGELAAQHGVPPASVSPGARNHLRSHDWPGNVRELQNVLERALVTYVGAAIEPGDLGLTPRAAIEPPTEGLGVRERAVRALADLVVAEWRATRTRAQLLEGLGKRHGSFAPGPLFTVLQEALARAARTVHAWSATDRSCPPLASPPEARPVPSYHWHLEEAFSRNSVASGGQGAPLDAAEVAAMVADARAALTPMG